MPFVQKFQNIFNHRRSLEARRSLFYFFKKEIVFFLIPSYNIYEKYLNNLNGQWKE